MDRESNFEAMYFLASRLVDKLDNSSLESIEVALGDMSVKMTKPPAGRHDAAPSKTPSAGVTGNPQEPAEDVSPFSAPAAVPPPDEYAGNIVRSPIVGVYYSAPSPGADSFIKIGGQVSRGTILCIVEAMKMMNEIESEYDGTVTEILVKNGDMVEYGQPLMVIG